MYPDSSQSKIYSEFFNQIKWLGNFIEENVFPHPIEFLGLRDYKEESVSEIIEKLKSNNDQLREIGKNQLLLYLNEAIKIHFRVTNKLKEFNQEYYWEQNKLGKYAEDNLQKLIEQIDEEKSSVKEWVYTLEEYITNLFEIALVYFPDAFKKQSNLEQMKKFVPENSQVRKLFESKIKTTGGPKPTEKEFVDYFVNRPDYYRLIQPLKNEFKNESATAFFFMLKILIEENILEDVFRKNQNGKLIYRLKPFHTAFENEFKNVGRNQYYSQLANWGFEDFKRERFELYSLMHSRVTSILEQYL